MAGAVLQLTEGTVPTTPGAGVLGVFGNALHIPSSVDPNGTQSVIGAEQWCIQTATQTANSDANSQTWFPSNTVSTVAVNASTTYQFEGFLSLANGTTSHTTSLLFTLTTATLTSIKYGAFFIPIAENSPGTPTFTTVNVATATVVGAASVVAAAQMYVRGFMRVNAGGTVQPRFQWSANPTGTNQVLLNSYFRIWPIGSNTGASIGTWT